jgi:outer membrane biosynthesis protein TonB
MQQLTNEDHVTRSRGVNPGTAIAILVAVAFCSAMIFISIAEMVYARPVAIGSQDQSDQSVPAALRPPLGEELATVEPIAAEEAAEAEPEPVEVEPELPVQPAAPRPRTHPVVRPGTRTDRPTNAGTPSSNQGNGIFSADPDPLGDLDFGPRITG